jgi:hypothetical protein
MEGTCGIPSTYRLRVKQRLAVVEYVRSTASSRPVGNLVSEAYGSAMVA